MATSLRPAQSRHEEFLFSLAASTRAAEMDLVDWNTTQKEAFLRMQFRSQDQYYKENYPSAEYQIIMVDGHRAGRLYVHKREEEILIIDISLLPEYRGQGVGSHHLNQILEEAKKDNLSVAIRVESFNPVLHLYERLGFCLVEDKGIYYFMKWSAVM